MLETSSNANTIGVVKDPLSDANVAKRDADNADLPPVDVASNAPPVPDVPPPVGNAGKPVPVVVAPHLQSLTNILTRREV